MSILKNRLKSPAFWLFLVFMIVLAVLPAITDSRFILHLVSTIAIFATFAASYNLLAGFTGIFSLGHAVFFGSGAYVLGIILSRFESTPAFFFLSLIAAVLIAVILGLFVGYLALRLKTVYYAMITFAVAELFVITADVWREMTGGQDGLIFQLPEFLSGRYTAYYIAIILLGASVLFMHRLLDSPTGKVLVAIRENEVRVSALGFNVFRYKLLSNVVAGVLAALAGIAYAVLNQFVMPSVLDANTTINALLMTIVGGMGTLAGPILGSAVITLFGDWLAGLAKVNPLFERWPIIFGLLYIVIILAMPGGIMSGYDRLKSKLSKPK